MTQQSHSALSAEAQNALATLFKQWVTAWNDHDARALAALHTEDAVTINRYGSLLEGRAEAQQALAFLRGPDGPFGDFVFPPMEIVAARQIAPDLLIAQTTWNAPVLGTDGKTVPGQFNQMILSYTLVRQGHEWKVTQIDGHNVDKMDLPFSSEQQKH